MKRFSLTIPATLTVVILIAAVLSCNIEKTEEQTNLFSLYYTIEPTSLLESLNRGEVAFIPVNQRPEFLPFDQQATVNWHQADYFHIANALYEGVLGKSLQGWQLNSMDFQTDCFKIQNGFQNGRFQFFSVVKDNDQESRLTSFIDIDPRNNFVHVSEAKYSPKLVDWKIIDMAQLQISADHALQIAENNGGTEKRETVGNACDISLVLSPILSPISTNGWLWEVRYSPSDSDTSLFHIQIDPYTGEIHYP